MLVVFSTLPAANIVCSL